jgi:Cof subfamily protein (haloacid dehalogenase superfamily)
MLEATAMEASATDNGHPIRLLIADIDGTLVNKQKLLTTRSVRAVERLGEAGILFGVTTGRPPAGARMLVEPLPALKFIAGFNGGIVVRRDFSLFRQSLLDASIAQQVVQLMLAHELDIWLYTDKDWFVRDPKAYRVDRESANVKFPPKVTPAFDDLYDSVAKIVGVSQITQAVASCERHMQEGLGSRVSAARSQPYYLDVTHPNANKGEIVITASEFAGIPTQEIATIGDMTNDIPMFKKSGMSIAMGNASPEVQRAATYVTASNEQEGFAQAVEDLVLPRAPAPAGRSPPAGRNGT